MSHNRRNYLSKFGDLPPASFEFARTGDAVTFALHFHLFLQKLKIYSSRMNNLPLPVCVRSKHFQALFDNIDDDGDESNGA